MRKEDEEGKERRRSGQGASGEKGEGGRYRRPPRLTAEEREMSRLEKKLGMKKRKRLPMSFREDGLDCIPIRLLQFPSTLGPFLTSQSLMSVFSEGYSSQGVLTLRNVI